MSIRLDVGNVQWTYKLAEGVCSDSMALVTARQYGITPQIIQRAEEFNRAIRDKAVLVEQLLQGNAASQSISDNSDHLDDSIHETKRNKRPKSNI